MRQNYCSLLVKHPVPPIAVKQEKRKISNIVPNLPGTLLDILDLKMLFDLLLSKPFFQKVFISFSPFFFEILFYSTVGGYYIIGSGLI
jgi:hypothetical protein